MSSSFLYDFLVIDDDSINNMLCTMYIKELKPEVAVHTFTKPGEGFKYIESSYPNSSIEQTILLLDINMPVLSGWDILDRLGDLPEAITKQIMTYILSSSIAINDKEKAETYKLVMGFIEKPLSVACLQAIIADIAP